MTNRAQRSRCAVMVALCAAVCAQSHAAACTVRAMEYKGWPAVQMENENEKITIVPELGGRVMQVEFMGHEYLFVNPRYVGKYISPEQAKGDWINYGGDKIWPMPEGNEDEQHWVLESGALDDGTYAAKTVEQGSRCSVELTGPADSITGLQYSRQISVDAGSTAIHFHAVMHNATAHAIRWSVQSVSQYNLSSAKSNTFNHKFWAYTAVHPASSYLEGYHVRSGLADDPSFSLKDGFFRLHWMYLSNEVWVDSPGGWLAVADGESGFGMIERFRYDPVASYPGKATVIFYKNGPSVHFNADGEPVIADHGATDTPYYMEAEVNSPMVTLDPSGSYAMDTIWFPLRTEATIEEVSDAGIVTQALEATLNGKTLTISGAFGVISRGHLEAHLFDEGGRDAQEVTLDSVGPESAIVLKRDFNTDIAISRVSLHLIDGSGHDLGLLGVARVRSVAGVK